MGFHSDLPVISINHHLPVNGILMGYQWDINGILMGYTIIWLWLNDDLMGFIVV